MDRLTATHNARQAGQRARIKAFDARLNRAEELTRQLCRKRGTTLDALTRDTRTADAKALDASRLHLTGKAPRTADESNHLATLAAKQRADDQRARTINEANAQRGIKGLLAKALAALS
jgi:hypothetical protein